MYTCALPTTNLPVKKAVSEKSLLLNTFDGFPIVIFCVITAPLLIVVPDGGSSDSCKVCSTNNANPKIIILFLRFKI